MSVCEQFLGRERLDQVVVRSRFKTIEDRFLPRTSGEKHDGDYAGPRVSPQLAKESEAIEARHHDITQNKVWRMRPSRSKRCLPVTGRSHLAVRSQGPAQVLPHVRVVVHHKDSTGFLKPLPTVHWMRQRKHILDLHFWPGPVLVAMGEPLGGLQHIGGRL